MANVSVSSVSRVLTGRPGVNKAKRAEIKEIIKKTGYVPSETARSLVRGRSNVVGIIVQELSNQYYSSMAVAFQRELRKYEYIPFVISASTNGEQQESYLAEINKLFDFAGLFISVLSKSSELSQSLQEAKCPVIQLNRTFDFQSDQVIQNDYMVGVIAANHLLGLNHENLCILAGPMYESISCQLRWEGFQQTLLGHGIELGEDRVIVCQQSMESAEYATREFFNRLRKEGSPIPTGVFVCGNSMVLGLLKVCAEFGIRVPEDLAIVTNDNPTIMSLPGIDVTTISIPMEDMVRNAVDIFRGRLDEPDGKKKTIVLQPEIIVRKSSGVRRES